MKNSTLLLTLITIGASGQLMGMEEQPPKWSTSFLVKYVPKKTERTGPYGAYKEIPAHFEEVKILNTDTSHDLKNLTSDLQSAVDKDERIKKYFTQGKTIYCAKINHLPQFESNSPKMLKVDIEQKN